MPINYHLPCCWKIYVINYQLISRINFVRLSTSWNLLRKKNRIFYATSSVNYILFRNFVSTRILNFLQTWLTFVRKIRCFEANDNVRSFFGFTWSLFTLQNVHTRDPYFSMINLLLYVTRQMACWLNNYYLLFFETRLYASCKTSKSRWRQYRIYKMLNHDSSNSI